MLATLIRLLRDFDLAEEALAEAFAAAAETWPRDGVPENPRSWLISTGRFRAIDRIRRRARFDESQAELVRRQDEIAEANAARAEERIEDDRLRLIFTCCHPAIEPLIQIALTLREVCGLTTEQIASAFLVAPATMAQRIVRGKAKIRDAAIPYEVPDVQQLPERLDSVLSVCYLVFNEGYSASSGDSLTRPDLSAEAIRLGRLLVELLPDAETLGLLALMLLHESRRVARSTDDGDIILLEDQDRSKWNRNLIREAQELLARALSMEPVGTYTIQAAISAVHAQARRSEETDWRQIVEWYDALFQASPSPVVELNRAVAIAMRDGPEAGLALIRKIAQDGKLSNYHLLHSAEAELLRRAGRIPEATSAFERALALVKQGPEKRYLERRFREIS